MIIKSFSFFGLRIKLNAVLMILFVVTFLFHEVLQAQQKREINDDLLSVSFPNEKDGWVCGRWGAVFYTGNGGKTWGRQNSNTDLTLSSIYFVDPQNGWAVGDEGIIIQTNNGGRTWEKQKSPIPFALMKVYFVSPLKGWVVAEATHILFTNDGGKNWAIQFKDKDVILKSISFCNSLQGWAVGEYGFIYHTDDGGTTWKKQAGKFEISQSTGDVEGEAFLFDIIAIDPKEAWAVGIDGVVIKTGDGGKTWKEVLTQAPKTHLFCITSDKAGKILIGGRGALLSSDDSGKTWKNVSLVPPVSYGWLYALAHRGGYNFVTVGWGGAIYLSLGNTWQRVGN